MLIQADRIGESQRVEQSWFTRLQTGGPRMSKQSSLHKNEPFTNADRAARVPEPHDVDMPRPGYRQNPTPVTRVIFAMLIGSVGLVAFLIGVAAFSLEVGPSYLVESEAITASLLACAGGLAFIVSAIGINIRSNLLTIGGALGGILFGALSAMIA